MDAYVDTTFDFEPDNISIPLEIEGAPNPALFLPREPDRPLNKEEKKWVQEAKANPGIIQEAPSAPALRTLQKQLASYEGPMPATKEQWQNFVLQKYFEQANDFDPKISKPALDALAKTSTVGLHNDVQEININSRATIDIEAELLQTIQKLVSKPKAIEGEVAEAEWTE